MGRSEAPRLDALTGLRYFAALAVVVAHFTDSWPFKGASYLILLSGIAMPLFFSLSGFVLAVNYASAFAQSLRRPLRSYLVARLARIYPLYILALLVSFTTVGNFFTELKFFRTDTLKTLGHYVTMTQSWFHVPVFQDSIRPRTVALGYLGPAWSISVECFFYLTFPLLAAYLLPRIRRGWQVCLGVGCLACFYLAYNFMLAHANPTPGDNNYRWWLYYQFPLSRLGEFMAGALAGKLFLLHRAVPVGRRERLFGLIALYGSVPALFLCLYYLHPDVLGIPAWLLYYQQNFGLTPWCVVVLYCLARYPSGLQRLLASPPLVKLGEASFAIYLFHRIVQNYALDRLGGEWPLRTWLIVGFNTTMTVVVLHVLCLGMFQFVDDPMRRWLRRVLDRKPGQVDGVNEQAPPQPLSRAA